MHFFAVWRAAVVRCVGKELIYMKEKKKPSYSAFANAVWAARMLIQNSPATFAILVLLIPVDIGLQYLGIYLPALVVSEVTGAQTWRHAFIAVGGVMLALMSGTMLKQALGHIQEAKIGAYRYKLGDKIIRKRLSMFFQTYENKEVRDLGSRADRATQMWNGCQPVSDIVTNEFGILKNILGYLLFGTVISFASPWLIPILTAAPVINLMSVRAYNKWKHRHRPEMAAIDDRLYFVQSLPNDFTTAKDIRIYSMASWLREFYQDLSSESVLWARKSAMRSFASRIAGLFVILLRDGGAYALLLSMMFQNKITVDAFILYFAAISSFASWVGGIIDCWNNIHSASLQICDFRDYIEYPEPDGNGKANLEDHASSAPEIVFDNVSFRYDGAESDTIHQLSFTIRSGEKLALVGLNGAGKTTVVKLLCGLYRPTSGEIRINGVPVTDFYREDYYKLISPVFQDVRTAFFSLAETVSGTGLKDTDLERAEQCMRLAGLGDKLDSLSEGIYTKLNKQVNANGTELSGGEAQKLMLARALYKDAPLLVLDEPTAALDPIAESRIYDAYNQMCKHKTSLFISHRLASTSFCDRILLLKDGRIAEEGTHESLLHSGGDYQKLFAIQSCWYQETQKA